MAPSRTKQILVFASVVVVLFACICVGYYFSASLSRINFEGRMTAEIPVNPLVLLTAGISMGMAVSILYNRDYPKKAKIALLFFTAAYSMILYFISNENSSGININPSILSYLTIFVCLFAAIPFLSENVAFKFSIDKPERDFVFFVTVVMWLSPLINDLIIWLRWSIQGVFWDYVRTMILGGKGFSDVLFYYGFWAFVTSFSFGVINRFLIKKGVSQKSG